MCGSEEGVMSFDAGTKRERIKDEMDGTNSFQPRNG